MPTKLTELQTPVQVTVSIFQYKSKRILHLKRTSTGRRKLKQFIECNQILESSSAIYESHRVMQFTNRPFHGNILYYINLWPGLKLYDQSLFTLSTARRSTTFENWSKSRCERRPAGRSVKSVMGSSPVGFMTRSLQNWLKMISVTAAKRRRWSGKAGTQKVGA